MKGFLKVLSVLVFLLTSVILFDRTAQAQLDYPVEIRYDYQSTGYGRNGLNQKVSVEANQKNKVNHIGKSRQIKKLKISYSSKNKKIAKVSKDGTITGVKKGKTTIIAKIKYKTSSWYKMTIKFKVTVIANKDPDAKPAGLYADDGTRVFTWKELVDRGRITVGKTLYGESIISASDTLEGSLYIPRGFDAIVSLAGCPKLKYVYIPSDLYQINRNAFEDDTSLEEVRLSRRIGFIGDGAFGGCTSLKKIFLPSTLTTIGYRAFRDCASLEFIFWPSSVDEILAGTFAGCKSLLVFEIPNGVTTFDGTAFNDCTKLQVLIFSKSVKKIVSQNGGGMKNCISLHTIKVDKNNMYFDNRDDCDALVETDHSEIVIGCKSTKIVSSIKRIGTEAFNACRKNTLVVPGTVELVKEKAFYYSQVQNLVFEDGIGKLEKYCAANDGDPLRKVYVSSGVRSIDQDAIFNLAIYTDVSDEDSWPSGWYYDDGLFGGAWYTKCSLHYGMDESSFMNMLG